MDSQRHFFCALHIIIGGSVDLIWDAGSVLLSAHYESFAGYYMPGISLTMGLRAKFARNKEP
jgi:hypothetical protein